MILEWILGKQGCLDPSGSGFRPVVGCSEHSKEPSRSVKGVEFRA
jgi:hypothetical protein